MGMFALRSATMDSRVPLHVASVAQPHGRDVPFELAAGPRQLRQLRGAAAPSKSKRALGEPKRPWV